MKEDRQKEGEDEGWYESDSPWWPTRQDATAPYVYEDAEEPPVGYLWLPGDDCLAVYAPRPSFGFARWLD